MTSNRRRAARRTRRVQIRFWRRGEPHAFPGYTTNISSTGMFVVTNSPPPSGTRLRLEVLDASRGFVVEAVVAHSRRVRTELQHTGLAGMGVRFLAVEELVQELFPEALAHDTEPVPEEPAPAGAPVLEPAPSPPAGGAAFSVRFASAAHFLEVYARDLVNGGLFVSTRAPGKIQETVAVDLHPPAGEPVRLRARVVQRVEPGPAAPNLLAGMGVELLDPRAVLERLEPIVRRLRGEGG